MSEAINVRNHRIILRRFEVNVRSKRGPKNGLRRLTQTPCPPIRNRPLFESNIAQGITAMPHTSWLYFLQPGMKRAHQPVDVAVGRLCSETGDDGGDGTDENVDG